MEQIKILEYTAEEFLHAISYGGELYKLLNSKFVFRGHASENWQLVPTALRKDAFKKVFFSDEHETTQIVSKCAEDLECIQTSLELAVLRDFFEKCDKHGLPVPEVKRLRDSIFQSAPIALEVKYEEWIPSDFYELVSLAQHFGIATRLLDWSYDLLVALFFAVSGVEHLDKEDHSEHIVIWALDSRLADISYYKMSPLRMIRPRYDGNPNIIAQKGLFTFWAVKKGINPKTGKLDLIPTNRKPLNQLVNENYPEGDNPLMYCIKVKSKDVKILYRYLKHNQIDVASIYPGYKGVIQSINDYQEFVAVEDGFVK